MGFISKEELEEKAKRYGINLDDYDSWSDKQKAVSDAEKESGATDDTRKEYKPIMISCGEYPEEMLAANYRPGKVRISTEIPTLKCNVMKYEEELGDAYDTSDRSMSFGMFGGDDRVTEMSRTYEIRKKAGKKVIAESTAPTVNTGLYYDPTEGWFPIVEFNGRKGYLFTHHKLINVKSALLESGYWEKYKDMFNGEKHPENIWMAGTKMLACSIPLVNYIIKEINKEGNR